MRALRLWIAISITALAIPATVAIADADAGSVSGTIDQCAGFPIHPFKRMTKDGITFTVGDICHVYSGTVAGVVRGVQYTVIFPDGSRLGAGQETLEGSVAGHHGTADLMFTFSRGCVPSCPADVHVWSVRGAKDLTGLQLDLNATGAALLTYTGTYSIDQRDKEEDTRD